MTPFHNVVKYYTVDVLGICSKLTFNPQTKVVSGVVSYYYR